MDPEFSEDEFDRLLRDEAVPDAILRAADLLETEALGICPQITKQIIEADEYDIMLADDISGDILLACDEAERVASLSEMLLQRKGDDPPIHSGGIPATSFLCPKEVSIAVTTSDVLSSPVDTPPQYHKVRTRRSHLNCTDLGLHTVVVVNSTTRNLSYWGPRYPSPRTSATLVFARQLPNEPLRDESSDEESRDSCSTPETSQIASSSVRSSSAATNSRASVFLPLDDNMNVSAELVYDSLAARPRFYLPANAVKSAPNPAPGTSRPTLKRKFHADSREEVCIPRLL
ncbi:hypothetical protein B0H14DRAFT_759394 [Mycena olivaceomarginata]|nr:hypothetical protein B0H14DRAFT_759394 [Mycena olivaceomarginata]